MHGRICIDYRDPRALPVATCIYDTVDDDMSQREVESVRDRSTLTPHLGMTS
jgi:hypothetical protein